MILSTWDLDLGLTIISHFVAKFLLLHQKRLLLLAFYLDDLFLTVFLTRMKLPFKALTVTTWTYLQNPFSMELKLTIGTLKQDSI